MRYWAPPATKRLFEPGQPITSASPGDMVIVHHLHSWQAGMIRFGQRLRKRTRPYAFWNHVAVVVPGTCGPDGHPAIIQEVAKGAELTCVNELLDTWRALIHPVNVSLVQVDALTAFCLYEKGTGYGWGSIVGDALNMLTGFHLTFGTEGRMVCSALGIRAHERLGLIPDVEPSMALPADAARYYDVKGPS